MNTLQGVVRKYHLKKYKILIIVDVFCFLLLVWGLILLSSYNKSDETWHEPFLSIYLANALKNFVHEVFISLYLVVFPVIVIITSTIYIAISAHKTYGFVKFPYSVIATHIGYIMIVDRNTGARFQVMKIVDKSIGENSILIENGIPIAIINVQQ